MSTTHLERGARRIFVIGVKLVRREEEGTNVETRSNPTIIRVLCISLIHVGVELFILMRSVLSERKVFYEGDAFGVEKYSHECLKEEEVEDKYKEED